MKYYLEYSDIVCPICGKRDVELFCVHMTGNYYQCKSTGTLLTMAIKSEIYFVQANVDKSYLTQQ